MNIVSFLFVLFHFLILRMQFCVVMFFTSIYEIWNVYYIFYPISHHFWHSIYDFADIFLQYIIFSHTRYEILWSVNVYFLVHVHTSIFPGPGSRKQLYHIDLHWLSCSRPILLILRLVWWFTCSCNYLVWDLWSICISSCGTQKLISWIRLTNSQYVYHFNILHLKYCSSNTFCVLPVRFI